MYIGVGGLFYMDNVKIQDHVGDRSGWDKRDNVGRRHIFVAAVFARITLPVRRRLQRLLRERVSNATIYSADLYNRHYIKQRLRDGIVVADRLYSQYIKLAPFFKLTRVD
jgi:hypothetical protein